MIKIEININQIQQLFPIKILLKNNLKLFYSKNDSKKIQIFKNNIEVASFAIYSNNKFNLSMEIRIEEESNLQNKGLAKLMIGLLLLKLIEENPNIRKDQLLVIDGDASGGFWDHIGMKQGRYSYMSNRKTNQTNLEVYGYEKEITFSNISMWALNKRLGI
jgi:hypothetical protein